MNKNRFEQKNLPSNTGMITFASNRYDEHLKFYIKNIGEEVKTSSIVLSSLKIHYDLENNRIQK